MTQPRIGQMTNPIVHLMVGLHLPKTACGKYRREALPEGHLWCRLSTAHLVSCPACQRLVPEVRGDVRR